jgi:hypothetical protein
MKAKESRGREREFSIIRFYVNFAALRVEGPG